LLLVDLPVHHAEAGAQFLLADRLLDLLGDAFERRFLLRFRQTVQRTGNVVDRLKLSEPLVRAPRSASNATR
jgi:hypothetical protein